MIDEEYYIEEYGVLFKKYFMEILEYEASLERQSDYDIVYENCFSIY